MIDTVLIALPWHDDPAVLTRLDSCSESLDFKTGKVRGYKGRLNNLVVILSERGLVVQGGLPAFYKGSSFHTLTPNETQEAINTLSDVLEIDVGPGRVYRVDFGFNLLLDSTAREVIRSLGPARARRRKLEFGPGSVVYKTKSHETAFYDKVMWAREKRVPIPDGLPDNMIRVERRIKKGVRGRLQEHLQRSMGPVLASQLGSPSFQEFGLAEWEHATEEIQFKRSVKFDFQRTTARTRDALASKGIESLGGLENLLDRLDDAVATDLWNGNSREVKRTRSELRRLANMPDVTCSAHIEEEFRRAVKQNVAGWRDTIPNLS